MTSEAFQRNFVQMAKAAKNCLDHDLQIPALVLVYSLIDSFAWAVAGPREKNTRSRFEDWLQTWVQAHEPIPCTPAELYAARCAVLHSLTSKADLNASGKIRQVVYAWGPADVTKLKVSIDVIGQTEKLVAVHINDLLDSVLRGINRTLEAASNDAALRRNLDYAAGLHFTHMKHDALEALLKLNATNKRLNLE